jgi:hypothetical protein
VDDTWSVPATPWRGIGSEGSIARKPAGQGKGIGASSTHDGVAWSESAIAMVWCQGEDPMAVAPTTTATAAAVAWGSNRMQKWKN